MKSSLMEPAKRTKFESKVMFWEGTNPSTVLQVFGNQYEHLDSGKLRPPDNLESSALVKKLGIISTNLRL